MFASTNTEKDVKTNTEKDVKMFVFLTERLTSIVQLNIDIDVARHDIRSVTLSRYRKCDVVIIKFKNSKFHNFNWHQNLFFTIFSRLFQNSY
jgi:hypothetical protein